MEAKEARERAAADKRELEERAKQQREIDARRAEEIRQTVEAKKLDLCAAAAQLSTCQKQLTAIADELRWSPLDRERIAAEDLITATRNAGSEVLMAQAIAVRHVQERNQEIMKSSAQYVCQHDVTIQNSIEAAVRSKAVSKAGWSKIDDLAFETVNGILLGAGTAAMPDSMKKAVTGANIGGKPSLTVEDVIKEAVGAANAGLGIAWDALSGPIKMAIEYWCMQKALAEIERKAAEAKAREEAKRLSADIDAAIEKSKDHRWNRDPGWIDFVELHSNIA